MDFASPTSSLTDNIGWLIGRNHNPTLLTSLRPTGWLPCKPKLESSVRRHNMWKVVDSRSHFTCLPLGFFLTALLLFYVGYSIRLVVVFLFCFCIHVFHVTWFVNVFDVRNIIDFCLWRCLLMIKIKCILKLNTKLRCPQRVVYLLLQYVEVVDFSVHSFCFHSFSPLYRRRFHTFSYYIIASSSLFKLICAFPSLIMQLYRYVFYMFNFLQSSSFAGCFVSLSCAIHEIFSVILSWKKPVYGLFVQHNEQKHFVRKDWLK